MPVEENKKTKKLRITLCVLFLFNIFCLALPYAGVQILEPVPTYQMMTGLQLIIGGDINDSRFVYMGVIASVFLILPAAGFFTAAFDKHRNIKCIVGFISSVLGVISITFMIGPQYISIGAVFAILLYLASCMVSVILLLTNIAVANEDEKTLRR